MQDKEVHNSEGVTGNQIIERQTACWPGQPRGTQGPGCTDPCLFSIEPLQQEELRCTIHRH